MHKRTLSSVNIAAATTAPIASGGCRHGHQWGRADSDGYGFLPGESTECYDR